MGQLNEGLSLYIYIKRKKERSFHSETTPGQKNMAYPALLGKSKIYLPPMHIKLGLIKIYVKAVDKESQGFGYLRQKFPNISDTKLK